MERLSIFRVASFPDSPDRHSQPLQSTSTTQTARHTHRTQSTTAETPPAAIVRTPTDRAPQTFNGDTDRLQNLIDEFNTAFATAGDRDEN